MPYLLYYQDIQLLHFYFLNNYIISLIYEEKGWMVGNKYLLQGWTWVILEGVFEARQLIQIVYQRRR